MSKTIRIVILLLIVSACSEDASNSSNIETLNTQVSQSETQRASFNPRQDEKSVHAMNAQAAEQRDRGQQQALSVAQIAKPLPENVFRLRPVPIMDPNGFGQPMTAASILVPMGWQTSGGVVWQINNQGCGNNGTSVQWMAASADGLQAVSLLPEQTWSGNNVGQQNGNCPNVWVFNIKDYLTTYAEHYRQGALVKDFRERADIAQPFAKTFTQRSAFPGGEYQSYIQAGEILLEYNLQGVQMEEVLQMAVVFHVNKIQGVYGQLQQYLTTSSMPGFSLRAPKGKLSQKLAEAIRMSAKPNPQYQRLMQQHNAKMAEINRNGAIARHQIRMDTNREISNIIQKGYEQRSLIQEQGRQKTMQNIRDTEMFVNPDTQTEVELPFTHKNAWELEDGSYILTDDDFFQPFRDLGVGGKQLERKP